MLKKINSLMEVYANFLFNEFPQSSFVQLLNVENITKKICEDFKCNKEEKNFVK